MKVLLLNAGSSSLKTTLVSAADGAVVAEAAADWAGGDALHIQGAGRARLLRGGAL
jgi:acetate kinase